MCVEVCVWGVGGVWGGVWGGWMCVNVYVYVYVQYMHMYIYSTRHKNCITSYNFMTFQLHA
jgi:hypothetical protein